MSKVSKKLVKSMRAERTTGDKLLIAQKAYVKGFKVKKYGFEELTEFRFNRYRSKGS